MARIGRHGEHGFSKFRHAKSPASVIGKGVRFDRIAENAFVQFAVVVDVVEDAKRVLGSRLDVLDYKALLFFYHGNDLRNGRLAFSKSFRRLHQCDPECALDFTDTSDLKFNPHGMQARSTEHPHKEGTRLNNALSSEKFHAVNKREFGK